MSDTDTHDQTAEPITDEIHDNSWSANLEKPQYADDAELAVRDALVAIDHTTAGNHVNLVTHGDLGHPEEFLYDAIERSTASTLSTSSSAAAAVTSLACRWPNRDRRPDQ